MGNLSRNRCNGLTIVEVLVALTVTGVGIVAVFGALNAANEAADRIRNEEYAQLLSERLITTLLAEPLKQMGTKQGSEGKYSWEEQVRPSQQPDIAEIIVTVRWQHRGRPFEFSLASLRAIK